jgi:hypothetical protein
VLLLIDSPGTNGPSTSGVLADAPSQPERPEGEIQLLSPVDRAGLIMFAFPLYSTRCLIW